METNHHLEPMDEAALKKVGGGAYVGSVFVYTVQAGDSLPILAHRFGTTVPVLRELNKIKSGNSIQPGTKLLIPLKG